MKALKYLILFLLIIAASVAPAYAEDDDNTLYVFGSKESLDLGKARWASFEDNGITVITKDIKDFDAYNNKTNILVMATLKDKAAEDILGADSPSLKHAKRMESSVYANVADKFENGQSIFLFLGRDAADAERKAVDTREDWWPVLASCFDVTLIMKDLFQY